MEITQEDADVELREVTERIEDLWFDPSLPKVRSGQHEEFKILQARQRELEDYLKGFAPVNEDDDY